MIDPNSVNWKKVRVDRLRHARSSPGHKHLERLARTYRRNFLRNVVEKLAGTPGPRGTACLAILPRLRALRCNPALSGQQKAIRFNALMNYYIAAVNAERG